MQSPHRQAPRARRFRRVPSATVRAHSSLPGQLDRWRRPRLPCALVPVPRMPSARPILGGGNHTAPGKHARVRGWFGLELLQPAGLLIPAVCTVASPRQPAGLQQSRAARHSGNISLPRPRRSTAGRGEGQRQGRLVTCDKPCATGGGTGRSGAPLCFWRGPYRTTPLSGGQTRKALKYSCDPGALRRTP